MENFKLASQQKLRFQTNKGSLSTEQLWDLSLQDLDALAVSLETEHKESGKKSFLAKKSEKDRTAKLRFDVALEILNNKVEEAEVLAQKAENKAKNKKIMELIESKKDEAMSKKSIRELESMLVVE